MAAGIPLLLTTWTIVLIRGPYALIVYSNSPRWQTYFEQQILPDARAKAAVLNWSERRNCRWPRRLRFFEPFRRGRLQNVERLRPELLDALNDA
jgi:hypothetical protein